MTVIPSQAESVSDRAGKVTKHWYQYFDQIRTTVQNLLKWERSFFIETPTASDYRMMVNAPHGVKIASVTTRAASGTATLTVKIDTTALGGTANAVSSTAQTQAHTTANTLTAGSDLVFTFSSVSSPSRVTVTIAGTRSF